MPEPRPPTQAEKFERMARGVWEDVRAEYEERHGKGSFRLYKQYQPELLRRLYPNVVAAERIAGPIEAAITLVSYGIVLHPFENANHRTFILIARSYLQQNGYVLPSGDMHSRWGRSASAYIRRSKRIRLKLSEEAYPGTDLVEAVADKHERMTRRWLRGLLRGQSGRSTTEEIESISLLISRAERFG